MGGGIFGTAHREAAHPQLLVYVARLELTHTSRQRDVSLPCGPRRLQRAVPDRSQHGDASDDGLRQAGPRGSLDQPSVQSDTEGAARREPRRRGPPHASGPTSGRVQPRLRAPAGAVRVSAQRTGGGSSTSGARGSSEAGERIARSGSGSAVLIATTSGRCGSRCGCGRPRHRGD